MDVILVFLLLTLSTSHNFFYLLDNYSSVLQLNTKNWQEKKEPRKKEYDLQHVSIRNSYSQVFCEKAVLNIFTKFTRGLVYLFKKKLQA